MNPPVLRVLMVDDHPVVLAGLKALVSGDPRLQIVGEARDGASALARARSLRPDIVVLDISLPEITGATLAAVLHTELPDCRVLVLTVHEDRAYVRQLLEAGAAGYLLKRSAAEELIRAIYVVAEGGVYLDPAIAGKAVGRAEGAANGAAQAQDVVLSEREGDVLRLVAGGHSNKEIAATLCISIKTVETYKARAMEKLGFRSRVDLVRYAAGRGWLEAR
jgi:DNA-binding NarL/FixJ family response regulator